MCRGRGHGRDGWLDGGAAPARKRRWRLQPLGGKSLVKFTTKNYGAHPLTAPRFSSSLASAKAAAGLLPSTASCTASSMRPVAASSRHAGPRAPARRYHDSAESTSPCCSRHAAQQQHSSASPDATMQWRTAKQRNRLHTAHQAVLLWFLARSTDPRHAAAVARAP